MRTRILSASSFQFLGALLSLGVFLTLGPLAPSMQAATFFQVPNGVWSTGFSVGGTMLPTNVPGTQDGHYTLVKTPAGCAGVTCQEDDNTPFGPATYVVQGPSGTYPMDGTWAPNGPFSLWIGPRSNQTNPVVGGTTAPNTSVYASSTDFYVYRMVFNLTALGLDPSTANLQLGWLSDNKDNADGLNLLSSHIRLCAVASASDPVCGAGTTIAGSANSGQSSGSLSNVSIVHGAGNANFTTGLMALDFVVYNSAISGGLNPSGVRVRVLSATADSAVPEPASLLLTGAGLIGLGLYKRRR